MPAGAPGPAVVVKQPARTCHSAPEHGRAMTGPIPTPKILSGIPPWPVLSHNQEREMPCLIFQDISISNDATFAAIDRYKAELSTAALINLINTSPTTARGEGTKWSCPITHGGTSVRCS